MAFLFGVIFVVTMLVLAIEVPNPTPFQYTVFRVVLALAAAGVAAMIPGFLELTVPDWIRAGGALAVFVVVFFYNPANLLAPSPSAALSPQQERVLDLLANYQRKFAANKLIISRTDGTLYLDPAPSGQPTANVVRDLWGAAGPTEAARFEQLIESMPPQYVVLYAEARFGNPFVLRVTDGGMGYLRTRK
jgi:hypothetical protein